MLGKYANLEIELLSITPSAYSSRAANASLKLQDLIVLPLQRYIKRQVEREIFDVVLAQAGFDPAKARVRLSWGSPEVPEVVMADVLEAAELGLIRQEEFRKNAVKFGWELWEQQPQKAETEASASGSGSGREAS